MGVVEDAVRKQEERTEVSSAQLSEDAVEDFEISLLWFRRLQPRIEEMRRRFKLLPKGKTLAGNYETIENCRSFEEWCERVLHKPAKVVCYLLQGGPTESKAPREKTDEIRSLSFTKEERKRLAVLFKTCLGDASTQKERKAFLRKTFGEYLDALLKGDG